MHLNNCNKQFGKGVKMSEIHKANSTRLISVFFVLAMQLIMIVGCQPATKVSISTLTVNTGDPSQTLTQALLQTPTLTEIRPSLTPASYTATTGPLRTPVVIQISTNTPVAFPLSYQDSAHAVLDWRTYSEDQYKFHFIYEKDWTVKRVDRHHLQILYKDAVLTIGYRFIQENVILAPMVDIDGFTQGNNLDFLGEPITILDATQKDPSCNCGGSLTAHFYDGGGEVNRGNLVFIMRLQNIDESKTLADIAPGELDLFDVIVSSFRVEPDRYTQAVGSRVNLAELGLAQTQSIEIGLFNPFLGGNAYVYQHLINDPDVISQVVKSLNQTVVIQPVPDCIAAYQLAFNLADGRKITFGYVCNNQAGGLTQESGSDGSMTFQGLAPVSPEFTRLLTGPLSQAERLRDNNQLPLWKSRIKQTSQIVGPYTLEDYAILDPGRYGPFSLEFKAIIPDDVFRKRADLREIEGNGVGYPVPPVKIGDHTIEVNETWDSTHPKNYAEISQDGKEIYRILIRDPAGTSAIHGLWAWNDHWVLEVDDHIIIDGQELNTQLGAQATFDWQIMNGFPFAFFIKQNLVFAWYDDKIYPLSYDQVIHNACCEPAMFNPGHNPKIVWFYAHKDNLWHYVEMSLT